MTAEVVINIALCAYVAKLLLKMNADIGENDIAKKYDMVYNQYNTNQADPTSKRHKYG